MNKTATLSLLLILAMSTMVNTQDPTCSQEAMASLKVDIFKDGDDSDEPALTVVTTYDAPEDLPTEIAGGEGFCAQYWQANGGQTCCDHDTLKARQKEIVKRAKHRIKQVKKALKVDYTEFIDDLIAVSEEADDSAVTRLRILKEEFNTLMYGSKRRMLAPGSSEPDADKKQRRSSVFQNFKGGKGKAKGRAKKAENGIGRCYAAYKKAQVNTLCLKCSTKAAEFYNAATESWAVDDQFCTDLASVCGAPLAYLGQQKALIVRTVELAKEIDPTIDLELDNYFIQDPADLETLNTCLDGDCSEDPDVRQLFCEKLNLDGDSPLFYLGLKLRQFSPREKVEGLEEKIREREARGGEEPPAEEPAAGQRMMNAVVYSGFCNEVATGGTDVSSYQTGFQLSENDIDDDEDFMNIHKLGITFLMVSAYFMF